MCEEHSAHTLFSLPAGYEFLESNLHRQEPLDPARVTAWISPQALAVLREFDIYPTLDSTNSEALRRVRAGETGPLVIVADQQTAGRGRRGRSWLAPAGGSICMSLVWPFDTRPGILDGLSLVVALSVVRAVQILGLTGLDPLQVKWPNDVWLHGRKLAGILLELQHGARHSLDVVIGIGINVDMPAELVAGIDQPVADLASVACRPVYRHQLLGTLVSVLYEDLVRFAQEGFAGFREAWLQQDALLGLAVELRQGERLIEGIHLGVDDSGALQLQSPQGLVLISGGEIAHSQRARIEGESL